MERLQVLPLHRHKEYVNECVKLLNSEWPRSETARLRSLNASCDILPTSLIMVYHLDAENRNNIIDSSISSSDSYSVSFSCLSFTDCQKKIWDYKGSKSSNSVIVVGHSKISNLCSVHDACFIESVVIHKNYRGKGWGKYLMEKSESFVKKFGKTVVYLTTYDKQGFYKRLGYVETDPVPIFGGFPVNINSQLRLLSISPSKNSTCLSSALVDDKKLLTKVSADSSENSSSTSNCAAAKVADSVAQTGGESSGSAVKGSQLSLVKNSTTTSLSLCPPLPPPPPPPPAPVFSKIVQKCDKNNGSSVVRGKYSNQSQKTFMMKFI